MQKVKDAEKKQELIKKELEGQSAKLDHSDYVTVFIFILIYMIDS